MSAPLRPIYVAEPPAQYIARPPAVVDSSVLCAALFNEPERAQAFAQMAGKFLLAPRLLGYEVISVALKKLRQGVPRDAVERSVADYMRHSIEIVDPEHDEQFALATRYGLSGYDAAYLWLAAELRAPLLTFDKKLGDAAQLHLQSLG
jgi:predicted nucleic acid-binding protein